MFESIPEAMIFGEDVGKSDGAIKDARLQQKFGERGSS